MSSASGNNTHPTGGGSNCITPPSISGNNTHSTGGGSNCLAPPDTSGGGLCPDANRLGANPNKSKGADSEDAEAFSNISRTNSLNLNSGNKSGNGPSFAERQKDTTHNSTQDSSTRKP